MKVKPDRKVVQTEVTRQEYELLQKASHERGVSIKEGAREAIKEWTRQQIPLAEDPFFNLKPVDFGVKTDSSKIEKLLYGGRHK